MTFAERIGEIIEEVAIEYGSPVYYEYGHPKEIFNTLAEKDQNQQFKYNKYPLIALYMTNDVQQAYNKGIVTVSNFSLVLMTETDPNYKADNRYDNTINPVLSPLYDLLINKLKWSKLFSSDDNYLNNRYDRLYYGTGDEWGNMLSVGNDALDAIVVQDMALVLTKQADCTPPPFISTYVIENVNLDRILVAPVGDDEKIISVEFESNVVSTNIEVIRVTAGWTDNFEYVTESLSINDSDQNTYDAVMIDSFPYPSVDGNYIIGISADSWTDGELKVTIKTQK